MANSITLPAELVAGLDEVYAASLLSIDLLGAGTDVTQGSNAKQIAIPKVSFSKGAAQYDKVNGYTTTDITVSTETVTVNFDMGNRFLLDAVDEVEAKLKAAKGLSEFERVAMAKAKDQFTFSTLAANGTTPVSASLADGDAWVAAIRAGLTAQDNAEVQGEKILYITPVGLGLIEDLDLTKSRAILSKFSKVVSVPAGRFFTGAIYDTANGNYKKDTGSKDIHFMIVEKSAVINYEKRNVSNIIEPDANQTADGYIMKVRKVGYVEVLENKSAGVYTHTA